MDIDELKLAYEHKLEIAVEALKFYSEGRNLGYDQYDNPFVKDTGEVAKMALEAMTEKPDEPLTDLTYKVKKVTSNGTIYHVHDSKYKITWTVSLGRKERGDPVTHIRRIVRGLRISHDKSTTASD